MLSLMVSLILVAPILLALSGLPAPALAQSPPAASDDVLRRAWDLKAEALKDLQQGRFGDGLPKAREAVTLREGALGSNHAEVGEALDLLGRLLERSADYPAAKTTLERALRIREAAVGPTRTSRTRSAPSA